MQTPLTLQVTNQLPEPPMTFDRAQLIEDYIEQIIEGMDYRTMERFVYNTLAENLTDYSDEQLITEVAEYNPELWKMWQLKSIKLLLLEIIFPASAKSKIKPSQFNDINCIC